MLKAFSLFELILVLIIVGVMVGVLRFYYQKDALFEGAWQIVNDLRYVRTLALNQESLRNKEFNVATKEWYKARWQLYFIKSKLATNNQQTYTIFLDKNADANANLGKSKINLDREIAVDILNPKRLMNSGQSGVINQNDIKISKRFNIETKFGIIAVKLKGSCAGSTRIVFDEFGRIYSPLRNAKSPYVNLLVKKQENCIIQLSSKTNKKICIVVDALSGYARIPEFKTPDKQIFMFKGKMRECSSL